MKRAGSILQLFFTHILISTQLMMTHLRRNTKCNTYCAAGCVVNKRLSALKIDSASRVQISAQTSAFTFVQMPFLNPFIVLPVMS